MEIALPSVKIGADVIQPTDYARNLGVIFDSTMSSTR
jgi:hypothetical protein